MAKRGVPEKARRKTKSKTITASISYFKTSF
jgi:hypothetical protein